MHKSQLIAFPLQGFIFMMERQSAARYDIYEITKKLRRKIHYSYLFTLPIPRERSIRQRHTVLKDLIRQHTESRFWQEIFIFRSRGQSSTPMLFSEGNLKFVEVCVGNWVGEPSEFNSSRPSSLSLNDMDVKY